MSKRSKKETNRTRSMIGSLPLQNSSLSLSLTGAEGAEVLGRLGDNVVAELFCFRFVCIGKKVRAGVSARRKEEETAVVQDCWPFDRHCRRTKTFFSLQQQQTHRHLDAAQRGAIGGDVKEDDGVGHFVGERFGGRKEGRERRKVVGDGLWREAKRKASLVLFISQRRKKKTAKERS